MMRGNLFRRHFLLTAGMILLSFALLGVTFISLSYQYTLSEKKSLLTSNASYVADFTGTLLQSGFSVADPTFQVYLTSMATISDADVILCERSGRIVFASVAEGETIEKGQSIPLSVVEDTLAGDRDAVISNLGGIYPNARFVAGQPILVTAGGQEQTAGLVYVTVDSANLMAMWHDFATIFFFITVVVLCIAFVSSALTSGRQTKPLKDMADTVRRFGQGEYDLRVPDTGRTDEVGDLTRAFNAMADAITLSEKKRREFIANVSHELKTPMTTIAGFADGILDGTIPREKEGEYLQVISSETRRLSRLVRKMLDLSQLQAKAEVTSQDQFDVSDLMCRVLISLEGKVNGKKLDVDAQLPDEPVKVWGDPDGITQVCYNLLDNAVKFSPEGGLLGIRIVKKGDKAYISVRNQGETIPPEELKMIFDRFHKTDKSRSMDKDGVGLGLYIVKTILNTHKETITVTSENGVTEFTFTLTLAK